jgi:hypothetical protein
VLSANNKCDTTIASVLSSKWCAAFKSRSKNQAPKISNPLQNSKPNTEATTLLYKQSAVVKTKQKKFANFSMKMGVVKVGGECSGIRGEGKNGAVGEKVVAGDSVWWPAVVVCGGWGVCEQWRIDGVKGKCERLVKVMGERRGKVT